MNNQSINNTEDDQSIRYFNIYINLFYIIFGNIGNLFKIAFLLQKPLNSLACTVYLLFSTFSDLITLNNLPILQLLIHLYPKYHWIKVTIDWSNNQNETILLTYKISVYDIIMCKIRSYLHMLSTDLSFQMILFASINRFCSGYHRKKRQQNQTSFLIRHFCDYSYAYRLCILSSIISALLSLQHIFNFTIKSPIEGCIPHNRILWAMWISSIHCFLLPILMIIFGILTLKNIHYLSVFGDYFYCLQRRRRCHNRRQKHLFMEMCSHCSDCQNSTHYQIDKQLTLMIIGEILVTILTSLPYGVYVFYYLMQAIKKRTIIEPNQSAWIPLLEVCINHVKKRVSCYLKDLKSRYGGFEKLDKENFSPAIEKKKHNEVRNNISSFSKEQSSSDNDDNIHSSVPLASRSRKRRRLADGKPYSGGVGRMTRVMEHKLADNYGLAIRQCSELAKNLDEDQAVSLMERRCRAALLHNIKQSDRELRHAFCPTGPDSWCSYEKDKHVPVFLEILSPMIDKLTNSTFLCRCLRGMTQNANESINSVMWSILSKTKYHGYQSIRGAAALSSIFFNRGRSGLVKFFDQVGIPVTEELLDTLIGKDYKRIEKAEKNTQKTPNYQKTERTKTNRSSNRRR
ncbi:unnamed protein product [Rotaria sp. Silwood1]|nr:unnamed protein product [Rotaria sp. Silwood1]